jgi:hypothetical protein
MANEKEDCIFDAGENPLFSWMGHDVVFDVHMNYYIDSNSLYITVLPD